MQPAPYVTAFPILTNFDYAQLPVPLQDVSRPFQEQAHAMARRAFGDRTAGQPMPASVGAETTAGLRKLLEAKDCAVRAAVAIARGDAAPATGGAVTKTNTLELVRDELSTLQADQRSLRAELSALVGRIEAIAASLQPLGGSTPATTSPPTLQELASRRPEVAASSNYGGISDGGASAPATS